MALKKTDVNPKHFLLHYGSHEYKWPLDWNLKDQILLGSTAINNDLYCSMMKTKMERAEMGVEDSISRFLRGVFNYIEHCHRLGMPFDSSFKINCVDDWSEPNPEPVVVLGDVPDQVSVKINCVDDWSEPNPEPVVMLGDVADQAYGSPVKTGNARERYLFASPPRCSRRQYEAARKASRPSPPKLSRAHCRKAHRVEKVLKAKRCLPKTRPFVQFKSELDCEAEDGDAVFFMYKCPKCSHTQCLHSSCVSALVLCDKCFLNGLSNKSALVLCEV